MTGPFDITWSHSSLNTYEGCPHQYYRVRVKKDVPFEESEAMREGNRIHLAMELAVRGSEKLPKSLAHLQSLVDFAKSLPNVEAEKQHALNRNMKQVAWFGRNENTPWVRFKIDVLSHWNPEGPGGKLERTRAMVVDWKTGSYWGPDQQPERTALGLFLYYPDLEQVNTIWYYMKPSPKAYTAVFKRSDLPHLMAPVMRSLQAIATSIDTDTWNKKPGSACKFCAVADCEYKGKKL